MEVGVHLPQIGIFGGLPSRRELLATVEAAVSCGAVALSANDHFAFPVPWLDGLIALAVASRESGPLDLVTSVTLPALRGPVPVASTLAGLSCLSDGRVIAGVGPGFVGGGPSAARPTVRGAVVRVRGVGGRAA